MITKIGKNNYNSKLLTTPKELTIGAMGMKLLDKCLIFKMNKGYHKFHMKYCLIPLDIIFVNNNRISQIYLDCQPCDGLCNETFNGIGDIVLEFSAGTANHFKIGDKVSFFK